MSRENQVKKQNSRNHRSKNLPAKKIKNQKNKGNKKKLKQRKKKQQLILETCLIIFLIGVLLVGQSFFFFSVAKINSYAMSPTLIPGEFVLIEKKYRVQREDILLVKRKSSQKTEIKRVIGLPNETIEYKDDQLLINNVERAEAYITKEKSEARKNGFNYTKDFSLYSLTGKRNIPADSYFVLGDNRLYSTDSREYGVIKKEEIIGLVSAQFY